MQSNHGRVGRELRQPQSPDLRQATLADATHVGNYLRVQDYIEAYLQSHGKEPVAALQDTYRRSTVAFAAYLEDCPIAVFGVTALGDRQASPWMMATPEADRFPKDMVGFGRQFTQAWLQQWDYLFNFVNAANTKSIRWLKHLGYKVMDPQPVGHLGAPFCLFYQYRTNDNVH